MINWLDMPYDHVVALSILAYDHSIPLCDLVRNLHLLDEQERRIVETIVDRAISEKTDRPPTGTVGQSVILRG